MNTLEMVPLEREELALPLPVRMAGKTHQGLVREDNQDTWLVSEAGDFAMVADGMGGHDGGGLASKAAVEAIVHEVTEGKNYGHKAQKTLAYEITWLVHGKAEADKAVRASKMLFGEKIEGLSDVDLSSIFADIPSTERPRADFEGEGVGLVDLMVDTKLQPSKGAARRLVGQGGGYVNNVRVAADARVTTADLASESMIVLRAGKKSYHVIRLV